MSNSIKKMFLCSIILMSSLVVSCSQARENSNPNLPPNTAVAIAADMIHNEIFVANDSNFSITVYGRTDTGNVPPVRTISGPNTGLYYPSGVAVDTENSEIFVANNYNPSITVYGRTDTGNVAPIRTISGANTGLSYPQNIALDTVNNQIFVANMMNIAANGTHTSGSITVYGRTDSGNVAPVRTISMVNTGISLRGLALDMVNNQIFVGTSTGIAAYNMSDTGNVAPVRTITGANTGLSDPTSIAVDAVNSEIFVANGFNRSMTVYGSTDNGNVAPLRTLSGELTGLSNPNGIALDTVNNQILVVNGYYGDNSIMIYGRTDSGNIAPVRSISGANTGM